MQTSANTVLAWLVPGRNAFSLVEVSLALALAAFALVAVLGALPLGLSVARDSQSEEMAADLAQRLQASLQQISFATDPAAVTVDNLAGKTYYYTQDGASTADPATAAPTAPPAYYQAAFKVDDALFNDGSAGQNGAALAQSANARKITVTLSFPQSGIAAGPRQFVYSFLVARQQSN